ncbi:MAG: M23 family metallopeptidase [Bacteroidota bacterium]|nr:M23 family metallopeptidase [Bacteroidota bacterium]
MRNKVIKWLRNRLQIIFRNKRDFKDISFFEFTNLSLSLYLLFFLALIFSISFFLSTTILSQWFDPRFVEKKANEELIRLSNSIDSLIYESQIKDQYIENIMIILSGGENEFLEKKSEENKLELQDLTNDYSAVDSFFRQEFESNLSFSEIIRSTDSDQNLLLMSPVSSGVVSSFYDPSKSHFGIDITCKEEEPIKSVLDGTVLMSSWTKDSGYVISIIHPNNLISVYKHNSKVFVEPGQIVKTGDVISIIGNTGELSTGPHLHFELWLNGKSINPSEFISL